MYVGFRVYDSDCTGRYVGSEQNSPPNSTQDDHGRTNELTDNKLVYSKTTQNLHFQIRSYAMMSTSDCVFSHHSPSGTIAFRRQYINRFIK